MKALIIMLLLSLTAGCSTLSNAPKYNEVETPRTDDSAIVTVYRTGESSLYLLRNAPVYLDNAKAVSLPTGSFHTFVLSPGNYSFISRTFDVKSDCVLNVALKQGGEYFLEVVPNTGAVGQLLADSFIWMAKVSITEQITTLSVGEYNDLCQGMFAFIPTEKARALQKLPELRLVE